MTNADYIIINNQKDMQFEIGYEGEKAYLIYRYYKKDLALMHTSVPSELKGRGIAGALTKAAFEYAEKLRKPVIVYCPFVAKYIEKHTEYKMQLDSEYYKR